MYKVIANIIIFLLQGCATQYRFISTPEGALVYQLTPSGKIYLGETPINYAKTALPREAPFAVVFEKDGFEPKELSILPSDNSLTTVAVALKSTQLGLEDSCLKRTRGTLKKIFAIQEQIFQKNYVEALSGLQLLEQSEPRIAEVFVLRGSIYVLLNDQDKAKREWEKALAIDPNLDAVKVSMSKLSGSWRGRRP